MTFGNRVESNPDSEDLFSRKAMASTSRSAFTYSPTALGRPVQPKGNGEPTSRLRESIAETARKTCSAERQWREAVVTPPDGIHVCGLGRPVQPKGNGDEVSPAANSISYRPWKTCSAERQWRGRKRIAVEQGVRRSEDLFSRKAMASPRPTGSRLC